MTRVNFVSLHVQLRVCLLTCYLVGSTHRNKVSLHLHTLVDLFFLFIPCSVHYVQYGCRRVPVDICVNISIPAMRGHFGSEPAVSPRGRYYCIDSAPR